MNGMFSQVNARYLFLLQGDATLPGDHLPVRLLPAGQQPGRQTGQLDPGDVQVPLYTSSLNVSFLPSLGNFMAFRILCLHISLYREL
jgi:hypothetical protein